MRRLFVLGLDCAPPSIMYEGMGNVELGPLAEIIEEGERYVMHSTHPPITIPAWISMFTGKTPGELGLYGFRHRRPGDLRASYIADSTRVRAEPLWSKVGKAGGRVGVVGVPPTYPPRPVHGFLVTDFITPGPEKPWTFPPWLKRELVERFGEYIFDVVFRSEDKARVARDLRHMLGKHLAVVKYLMSRKEWDLMIYVEIGVDRAHHAFWKYFDPEHPRHEEHEEFSRVIPEVYERIGEWFGEVRKHLKDTVIAVLSDHGAKYMKGAFAVNQWLEEEGYLKLKERPKRPGEDLRPEMIDWGSTVAWAWGGYYSRIFINLRGREPNGVVGKEEYWELIKNLRSSLERVRGPNGEVWDTKTVVPSEIYPVVNGDPPDLMVYFDNLYWRAAGTIGWPSMYLPENDRGPDDAVHDWYGVLTIYDPEGTHSPGDRGVIKAEEVYGKLAGAMGLAE